MPDPVEGVFGSLVMSGWVADAPTGHEEAFLMLTTPDTQAAVTMPAVAAILGLRVGRVGTAQGCVVRLAGGWVTLDVAGQRFERPVNGEWARTARSRGQVVLVVGTEPHPTAMGADEYTERYGQQAAIGLTPLEKERDV